MNPVTLEFLAKELRGPPVETVAGHDTVALLHDREQTGRDRRHARATNDRPGGLLVARQLIGQEAGIGMAVAGVDEARLLVVHDLVEGVEIWKRID